MTDRGKHAFGISDLIRFLTGLAAEGDAYLSIRNAWERLTPGPGGLGFRCEWEWHSGLVIPAPLWQNLATQLLRSALRHAPVILRDTLPFEAGLPEASFIIGHRGRDRLPQLLATLRSIAGQDGVACECIVVEQDDQSRIRDHLPAWVRHVLIPPPVNGMAYSRSWAFNVGVRMAKAPVVILHDGDLLVPSTYVRSAIDLMDRGYEVVNAKRFIFYLEEADTRVICSGRGDLRDCIPGHIKQNADGGGSIVLTRAAYDGVGGMDERFIGWGCEDNEFWQRARVRSVWDWGYLPLFHLWHPDQSGKLDSSNPNDSLFESLSEVPVQSRVDRLRDRPRGLFDGPLLG